MPTFSLLTKKSQYEKTIILLLLCAAIATGVNAQTKQQTVLKDKIEVKKAEKHQVGKDLAHLRVKKAMHKRKEVVRHRKSIHRTAKNLKKDGVNHPIKQAKEAAKLDKTKRHQ